MGRPICVGAHPYDIPKAAFQSLEHLVHFVSLRGPEFLTLSVRPSNYPRFEPAVSTSNDAVVAHVSDRTGS